MAGRPRRVGVGPGEGLADDAALHEAVELDAAQEHVDEPGQDPRDDPPDYQNKQEDQDLRDRVKNRVEQILEARAYLK
jgi:hypothetical protein